MELIEWIYRLIAGMPAWIWAHVWIVPLVCAGICFLIVGMGKLEEADNRVQRLIESQEEEGK